VVSFTPRPLYPRKRVPGTHWVDSKAVLVAVVKRKIPAPYRESNPRTPIVQPIFKRYTTEQLLIISKLQKFSSEATSSK
jgi:hypothetical protein